MKTQSLQIGLWEKISSAFGNGPRLTTYFMLLLLIMLCLLFLYMPDALASVRIPGSDESGKLEAAGTLLRLVDTMLFVWAARIIAGLCVLFAGWSLKEQQFGVASLCLVGAIFIGTAPIWVKNIFDISGGNTLFSFMQIITPYVGIYV